MLSMKQLENGHDAVVQAMLKHTKKIKNYINLRISKGNKTPLHIACGKNDLKIAQMLIDFGADLTTKTNKGETAMELTSNKILKQYIQAKIDEKNKKSGKKDTEEETGVAEEMVESVATNENTHSTKRELESEGDTNEPKKQKIQQQPKVKLDHLTFGEDEE